MHSDVATKAYVALHVTDMQVSISKKELLRLLARCQGVADKKSTMPVLGNVLLETVKGEGLRLAATDLFLSVSGTIPAEVTQAGSVAVGAKDLFERAKMMPEGKISIESNENASTTLRADGQPRRYTLHGVPGADFPDLPDPEKAKPIKMSVETLSTLIAATHFSISTDETRVHLNSALLEWDDSCVRMVSTDGHRLSKIEVATDKPHPEQSMLIPLKGILELKRLCEEAKSEGASDLKLAQAGPNAFFEMVGIQFSVKLVDAQFPPYQQVIPASAPNQIQAPRHTVVDALRAVSIAASDRTGGVKLTLDKNVIRFSSESPESGDGFDEVDVDYSGDTFTVGFNAKYLLDVLSAMDGEDLKLGISGELDPAVVTSATPREGVDHLAVVMPMRI